MFNVQSSPTKKFKLEKVGHCGPCPTLTSAAKKEKMPVPIAVMAKQSVQQEVVRVSHTSSISLFCMNVQVGDIVVNAVVDSASEVSIISEKVYKSMKHPPPTRRLAVDCGQGNVHARFYCGPN
ncbi:hypothetical protein DPMN_016378 [Dreissena polymorpha]|uniref:Uncharacterized protein n=1 Tax=Dreissena polymorpha TaxID=45954 RepID=A0A9D4N9L1_DREPO|nr:hypothetical protein DPMN_016378 [Dreissena polymorpha]